jgi:hypothetical protein
VAARSEVAGRLVAPFDYSSLASERIKFQPNFGPSLAAATFKMNNAKICDVAVIGADPFSLSIAADV